MKVLHVTTNYPTPDYPIFGIFVKEQVESLQKLGLYVMFSIVMVRTKDLRNTLHIYQSYGGKHYLVAMILFIAIMHLALYFLR